MPVLIESNAHLHQVGSSEPFIATEFINGPTLTEWRLEQGLVTLETALVIALSLLEIVKSCHNLGCVHRDIKPDNIKLKEGNPKTPALLDFGLTYHELIGSDFATEHGQEIGNRFLRLPELSAGSILKQDPRSDLSFVAGVLFYALTGKHPDILQDAEGRLPHQRLHVVGDLHEIAGAQFRQLSAIFDRSFSPLIADRYADADSMITAIQKLLLGQPHLDGTDDLTAILDILGTSSERRKADNYKRISEALRQVNAVFTELEKSLGGTLALSQTAWNVIGDSGTNTLFWSRIGSNDRLLSVTYEARVVGDEIAISLSGEPTFRTSVGNPKYNDDFRSVVQSWLLARLRLILGDTKA
jgi:serine/threonine-protein kinase